MLCVSRDGSYGFRYAFHLYLGKKGEKKLLHKVMSGYDRQKVHTQGNVVGGIPLQASSETAASGDGAEKLLERIDPLGKA